MSAAKTEGFQGMKAPTFSDVLAARRRIQAHLHPTPIYHYSGLDELTGCETWVKHENHQPVGAFKVRGGVNLVSCLSAPERTAGLITASTGNHGASVAFAARLFGVKATICLPEAANAAKVARMRHLGAELVFFGRDFDEAREHCERLAVDRGSRYVHSGNEPLLIAGVATGTLEIVEALPDVDAIVVPVGGGSGAAGACIVAKAVNPAIEVVGVQSEAAPAAYRSWRGGELVEDSMATFAEGLATRTAFALPQAILRDGLDDFWLVTDSEIKAAMRTMIATTQNLCEAAGAAALAGLLRYPERFTGRKVAIICSGGNVTLDQLQDVLASPVQSSPVQSIPVQSSPVPGSLEQASSDRARSRA
jgi:threonine dehydratase